MSESSENWNDQIKIEMINRRICPNRYEFIFLTQQLQAGILGLQCSVVLNRIQTLNEVDICMTFQMRGTYTKR